MTNKQSFYAMSDVLVYSIANAYIQVLGVPFDCGKFRTQASHFSGCCAMWRGNNIFSTKIAIQQLAVLRFTVFVKNQGVCYIYVAARYTTPRAHKNRRARVRACNYIKFETSRNLLPVLKIATRTALLHVDISD